MTISAISNRVSYAGDGSTTAFSVSYPFFLEGELLVIIETDSDGSEAEQTLTTDYTVSGGAGSTGTVTMVTAPASGETLHIIRDTDAVQKTDLVNNSAMDAETLEDALDRRAMREQRLFEHIERALRVPETEAALSRLPKADDRKDHFLYFDDTTGLPVVKTKADLGLDTSATSGENVAGYSALKARATSSLSDGDSVFVTHRSSVGDGGHGWFAWRTGNQSTNVTNDPGEGVWVPPTSDATGASGAWERQYVGGVWGEWFGAVGNDSTDNSTTLQNALDYVAANQLELFLGNGVFRCSGLVLKAGTQKFQGFGYNQNDSASSAGTVLSKNADSLLLDIQSPSCPVLDLHFDSAIADSTDGVRINSGGRNTLRIAVHGMGQDGVVYHKGNLCLFEFVVSTGNARYGFYANVATVDTNASQFSLLDCRGNGSHGIFFEANGGADDVKNSRRNTGFLVGQGNTGDGVRIETSNNHFICYGENNTGNEIHLNTSGAINNHIQGVQGVNVVDNSGNKLNFVHTYNGTTQPYTSQWIMKQFWLRDWTNVGYIEGTHSADRTFELRMQGTGGAGTLTVESGGAGTLTTNFQALQAGGNPVGKVYSWTPVLKGTSTVGTNSYSSQVATATEVGDRMIVSGELQLDGTAGALNSTGNLYITGMPKAAGGAIEDIGGGNCSFYSGVSMASGEIMTCLLDASPNNDRLRLRTMSNTGTGPLQDTDATDSLRVWFHAVYKTT